MATPNIDTAMELLGIPDEYHDEVTVDFASQWGGVDISGCERALRNGGEEDEFSRAFALLALASSEIPNRATLLRPYVNDPSPLVRVASAVSLGYLGDPTSLPYLQKLIMAPHVAPTGGTDEEAALDGMRVGLVWGCIPEILGQLYDQNNLAALRQALSHVQADRGADLPARNARTQSLIYAAGRLGGWGLFNDVQDVTSRQDLALLMALGFLQERMVAERTRHLSGGRTSIPPQLDPERTVGALIEQVLTRQLGFTAIQAHAMTESKSTDAYLIAGRLLSGIERHSQMFPPLQPLTAGMPSPS